MWVMAPEGLYNITEMLTSKRALFVASAHTPAPHGAPPRARTPLPSSLPSPLSLSHDNLTGDLLLVPAPQRLPCAWPWLRRWRINPIRRRRRIRAR